MAAVNLLLLSSGLISIENLELLILMLLLNVRSIILSWPKKEEKSIQHPNILDADL